MLQFHQRGKNTPRELYFGKCWTTVLLKCGFSLSNTHQLEKNTDCFVTLNFFPLSFSSLQHKVSLEHLAHITFSDNGYDNSVFKNYADVPPWALVIGCDPFCCTCVICCWFLKAARACRCIFLIFSSSLTLLLTCSKRCHAI